MADLTGMDLVRKWASEAGALSRVNASPTVCEDCGNKTDLGHKCRACYAQWKRLLWQDLPTAQRELTTLAKELNKVPASVRKDIADLVLGHTVQKPLGASHAQLLTRVFACVAGPMGGSMEMKLHAIRNATEKEPGKSRGAREEAE
jgi:hypothetical protein